MKKRILSGLLVAAMLLTSLPTAAFAADDTNAEAPDTGETQTILPQSEGDAEQSTVAAPSYEVSTTADLSTALTKIAANADTEATIVLKADITLSNDVGSGYITSFGVDGKHITVKSEGEMKKLSFPSYGVLTGDCTFDNVYVIGRRLFCNGYRTIFTENGQIYLSETLYGGGYKRTVDSTYVVIAANGSINPSYNGGLHDVIGGSYQGSVKGDTYLEITGNLKMDTGSHINPGCMKGDGSSGDGASVSDVYVGGNATLIYDNPNGDTSPTIEGTYGCEMKGNVTLDVRAGSVLGIAGTEEPVDESIIRGDLHIIAGNPAYENTDRILMLVYNWSIIGAGHRTASIGSGAPKFQIGGNVTIDTYENVWNWEKGSALPSDISEIYGAYGGEVGGDVIINAHGSHVGAIYGASDSDVHGAITITATDVELKSSRYGTAYDDGYLFGLWENYIPATAGGPVTINIHGGDIALTMATDQTTVPAGSSFNITGSPNIRIGIRGTQASSYSTAFPVANLDTCTATIPYIKMMSQVNVINNSNVTAHIMSGNAGLMVEEGSTLTTDKGQAWIWGNTVINGTWEQLHSQTANYNDIFISGTTQIGSNGHLINHGTSNLKGAVTNNGVMALMGSAYLQNDYTAINGEFRLPAVTTNYDGTSAGAKIPVQIEGLSTGTTTVNTVDPANWQTLKKPALGDNYILSMKNTDSPAQDVFVLGNADAVEDGWFLKRMADADGTDDYYMWQVASGIRVIFDKNGGDTEADPRIMVQDKVDGAVNHFDLPTTEPTRSGYIFTGWNTKADGSGDAFTAATDVTSNITVYAQWKDSTTYSVTYKDGVDGTVFADQTTAGLHVGDTTPAFSGTPTRSGYTFTGWEPSVADTVTDNAVYTAQWAKNSSSSHHSTRYTLHYESNGGTAYKDERYSSGTKVTLDKTPTRESYTFTGWYADKALTQKITSVTMNSDKTVYAGWEATGVPDKLNGDDHFAYVIGYPDGKVHPKGNISRAETATIFFRLLKADIRDGNLTADNDFSDVSDGKWYNKAISTMTKLGIVKGRRADSFDPDASITRAEFAAICARFNTKPVENSGSFSDISGHWAENEIERAAAFGWISGYPDGTFHPDARITRAEAMTMINRVLCRMPQSESDLLDSMVTWPDNKPSDWHYLAVQEATNSHDFNRQGEVGESWTKLTSVPDWKRYQ